jgi:hypothetical protein
MVTAVEGRGSEFAKFISEEGSVNGRVPALDIGTREPILGRVQGA